MHFSCLLYFAVLSLGTTRGDVVVPPRDGDLGANDASSVSELHEDHLFHSSYLEGFQARHVLTSLAGNNEGYKFYFGSHQDTIQSKEREFAGSFTTFEKESSDVDASTSTSTATSTSTSTLDITSPSFRRNLPEGDFDEFQEMFRRAVIRLPDFEASKRIGFVDMGLQVTNILCREIILGDMLIDYNKENNQRLTFGVNIHDLDLRCDMDFGWSFGFLSGGGQASVRTVDSCASAELAFTSRGFDQYPPHSSYTESCNADINIADLDFTGSVSAAILSVFESIISKRVESEVAIISCDELGSLGTTFLGDVLETATKRLAQYSGPLESWRLDSTFPEQLISVPDGVQLVKFQDTYGTSKILMDGINEANWYFSTWFESRRGPSRRDLGINMFLRQNILDNNRAFTLNLNDLPNFDPLVFEGHDRLTETRITLDSVKIFGLDTFQRFEPVLDIGNYTYQVDLQWEYLKVEVNATVHMKPSTLTDSLLENPRPIDIFEKIQIDFGVDDVDAIVAILLAIDQEAFEELEVGSFLTARNVIPCLLSTIHKIGISGLGVSVGNVHEPTLTGFISKGIDRVVTRSVEAAFLMYEGVIIQSMPSFFQATVRDLVTDHLIKSATGSHCSPAHVVDEIIDFRDLFLEARDSIKLGGFGDERYGDLVGDVFTFLRDQITTSDEDGLLQINPMIIRPLTERQSGVEGMIRFFDSEFLRIDKDDLLFDSLERLEFSLSDGRLQNIDTFVAPTEVLQPTKQAQCLLNGIKVGSVPDRELNATVTMSLNLIGKQSRSTMFSEIDITVAATSLELMTDILAVISSPNLLHFPLKDITNLYCWIAIMQAPILDENGRRVNGNYFLNHTGLSFNSFLTSISSLRAVANCRNCTASGGFAILPELMEILDRSQVTKILGDRLGSLADEVVTSRNVQTFFDRIIYEAPKYCPHSSRYQTETAELGIMQDSLSLSAKAMDTFLFAAATTLQMGFVILTESHHLWPSNSSSNNLLSKQHEFAAPEGLRLLDWTNFKNYLKISHPSTSTNGNDKIEPDIMQEAILEHIMGGIHHGTWKLQTEDFQYDNAMMTLSIDSVRISGLDSFTHFELLDVIAPQTLKNSFHLEKISFELDLSIKDIAPDSTPQHITLLLEADDLNVTLPFFVAIDLDLVGDLKLGSMLHMDEIIPCILSTIYEIDIPEAIVTIGHLHKMTVDGLDTDTGSAFSDLATYIFDSFGERILTGLSSLLQTQVRDFAAGTLAGIVAEAYCPPVSIIDEFIDFRDLLLKSNDSLNLGGNGDERYGDLAGTTLAIVRDQLMADIDNNGLLAMNPVIIDPLTQLQSGVEGMLHYYTEFFSLVANDLPIPLEMIEFSLSNIRIRNLNTLMEPSHILQPTEQSHSLWNRINMGPVVGRPLNVTVAMSLNLVGENSPLAMFNEFEISIAAHSFELLADILAMTGSPNLLHFPLKDISNFHCWLATMPAPELDENGIRYQNTNNLGLSFHSFFTRLLGLKVDAFCRNCAIPDIGNGDRTLIFSSALQEVMKILNESNSRRILGDRFGTLVQEVMVSDSIQNVLDHLLIQASKVCPHSSGIENKTGNFSGSMAESMMSSYEMLNMPPLSLSSESVDTILFTGVTVLHVGFILLTEIHRMWPTKAYDALSIKHELAAPEAIRLLDWTNMEDSFSPLVNFALKETNKILNSWEQLSSLTNNILNGLLGSDGYVTIPLKEFEYETVGLAFKMHSARISGLDSFTNFTLLDAIAPQILQNFFHLARLSLELDISLDSTATTGEPPQHITVLLEADDINITLPLFIALDLDLFDSLELGSLLHLRGVLPCIASTIYDMHISQMMISMDNLHEPIIKGLMPATQSAFSSLTTAMFEAFGKNGRIEEGLASLIQNSIRPWINQKISSYIADSTCENFLNVDNYKSKSKSNDSRKLNSVKSDNRYVDFRDLFLSEEDSLAYGGSGESPYGDLFNRMYNFLQENVLQVDEITGLAAVNDFLVGPLVESTSGQGGTIYFGRDIFNHEVKINVGNFNAEIRLRLFDAAVSNIDQIGAPLSLLEPVVNDPHQLNNTVSAGAAKVPLRFTTRFFMEIMQEDGVQIINDMAITADFHALTVFLTTLIKISEEKFAKFPIRDLSNIHCWLATVPSEILDKHGVRVEGLEDPSAAIKYLAASVARLDLNIECFECTSPGMESLTEILSTTAAANDLTTAANGILNYVAEKVGDKFIQVQIDRLLTDAPRHCPHSPQYEAGAKAMHYEAFQREISYTSISYIVLFVSVAGYLLFIMGIIYLIVWLIVRRRHQKWLSSLPRQRLFVLRRKQREEDQVESELNFLTKSMFQSSAIPLLVRLFIPIVILGNIAFFLSGHLSLGAAVNIEGQLAGERFVVEQFFEFSMAQSTIDIWQAGGRELAILILVFSGIWPYTKQLVTLVLWFLPPKILSISSRGSILLWLDALAKWSMIDIFTLLVTIVAFRVSVVSPDRDFLPDDFYSIHLMVVPKWGLYANMIAQLISQVSSHYIIYYHRRIVGEANKKYEMRRHVRGAGSYDTIESSDDEDTVVSDNSSENERDSGLTAPAANLSSSGNGVATVSGIVTRSYTRTTTDADADNGTDTDISTATRVHQKDQLCHHTFARPHRGEFDRLVIRQYVNYLFCTAILLSSVLLIVGCVYPTFVLEVFGIVGIVVESGQGFEEAKHEYSIFGMVKLIMDQANLLNSPADYIGLGALSSLCILSVLVVPLMQTVALTFQWLYPMGRKLRSQICTLIEILQAWQYVEVYIISVLVASWQLAPVSEFMLNAYCASLNDTLAKLKYYEIIHGRDAQCFQVQPSIGGATYLILASALLLTLLNTFVMKAARQYFRDKDSTRGNSTQLPSTLPYNKLLLENEDDVITGTEAVVSTIRPVPVLFTDMFRWLLLREDSPSALTMAGRRRNHRDAAGVLHWFNVFENESTNFLTGHGSVRQDSNLISPDVEAGSNELAGNMNRDKNSVVFSNKIDQEQLSSDDIHRSSNNDGYPSNGIGSNLQHQDKTKHTTTRIDYDDSRIFNRQQHVPPISVLQEDGTDSLLIARPEQEHEEDQNKQKEKRQVNEEGQCADPMDDPTRSNDKYTSDVMNTSIQNQDNTERKNIRTESNENNNTEKTTAGTSNGKSASEISESLSTTARLAEGGVIAINNKHSNEDCGT